MACFIVADIARFRGFFYAAVRARILFPVCRDNQAPAAVTAENMVKLFLSSKANISEHIKHIFDEEVLVRNMVVRKFRTSSYHVYGEFRAF